jgi:hypothetical protein
MKIRFYWPVILRNVFFDVRILSIPIPQLLKDEILKGEVTAQDDVVFNSMLFFQKKRCFKLI